MRKYICVHISIILLFDCFIFYKIIHTALFSYDLPVDGNIPTSLNVISNDMKIPVSISILIYFPSIILYFAVGLILKYREAPSDQNSISKVYRSLFLIIFVNIGCYTLGLLIKNINSLIFPSENFANSNLNGILTGVLVNIGCASNAPILYINSTDYKEAYKKEVKLIKTLILIKCFGIQQTPTTVHPIIQNVQS
ncbi:unnamed protein product [Meloidogyne enterolobii]|uniref:Uncharacterized protein n=1 Tax=Meloidogyne enterolobii TaxID=390850 RepID=A0ACB0Z2E5_MELEN